MQLSEKAIRDFRKLYFQASGQILTTPEAVELGMRLINLLKAVYGTDISRLKKLNLRQKNEIIQWYSTINQSPFLMVVLDSPSDWVEYN